MIELATMTPSLQVTPLAPVERLNFDILCHLFTIICISDPFEAPMLISHVSPSWRQAALLFPLMWSTITIRLWTSPQEHPLALAYLERSPNVPLFVTIHAIRTFDPWEKTKLLLPYANRFQSLHVKASAGVLANVLWLELNIRMPRLEVFESIISNTSRINIRVNRKIATVDETVNIFPSVSTLNLVCWKSWNPTGLTQLTLDTTRLLNKPDLDDIYNALASARHTIQHFEYIGLVACIDIGVNIRTRLVFPELRSLAVLSHDDMVPLLRFMVIPDLDSLILRDFIACPHIPTLPASELMAIDELTPGLTFDPDGLFRIIREWKTVTHLEIFGIDDLPSDDSFPPPDLLNFITSLNQLSSLVLYGDGAAMSVVCTLFNHRHHPAEEPLLPQLSHFLLAVNNMPVGSNDDLCHYLVARQQHGLPRLEKLSVNWEYVQHLIELDRINILRECSDNIFVIADPEFGTHKPISEVNLLEILPYE